MYGGSVPMLLDRTPLEAVVSGTSLPDFYGIGVDTRQHSPQLSTEFEGFALFVTGRVRESRRHPRAESEIINSFQVINK
jgi:hypothetical protein